MVVGGGGEVELSQNFLGEHFYCTNCEKTKLGKICENF